MVYFTFEHESPSGISEHLKCIAIAWYSMFYWSKAKFWISSFLCLLTIRYDGYFLKQLRQFWCFLFQEAKCRNRWKRKPRQWSAPEEERSFTRWSASCRTCCNETKKFSTKLIGSWEKKENLTTRLIKSIFSKLLKIAKHPSHLYFIN